MISCKAIRSRGRLTILYLFIVNTVIYLPFIQEVSIFQKFLGNSNKLPLDATAQSLFIVLEDHKSADAVTLTRDRMKIQCAKRLKNKGMKLKMLLQQREQSFRVNLLNLSSQNL